MSALPMPNSLITTEMLGKWICFKNNKEQCTNAYRVLFVDCWSEDRNNAAFYTLMSIAGKFTPYSTNHQCIDFTTSLKDHTLVVLDEEVLFKGNAKKKAALSKLA